MIMKKQYKRVLAACLAVSLLFSLAACKQTQEPPTESTQPTTETQPAAKVEHTVTITDEDGTALEGVGVFVYTDSTKEELVTFAKTDAAGKILFTDVESDGYVAQLNNVPEGFTAEEFYPLTGTQTRIVLAGVLPPETELDNITYALGDQMQDFSVTAADGTVYVLSELLKQKKAVVLNFWFTNCQPCRSEFPYLQAAYERFAGEIEVLALNPVDSDPEKVEQFRKELGLTFPMMACDSRWEKMMQIVGYPTTVVIDRNGMISLTHTGTITESGVFEDIFTHFTADGYESAVVKDIEDILSGNNADSPIEIGGVSSFEVTVKPGKLVYYNIYKVTNMYLQVRHKDAYAIYKDYTYEPINGAVGFTVTTPDTYTPTMVIFGNSGTKEITFTVTLSAYPGTSDNPYDLSLGQFEARVSAGNDQGVHYEYTAQEEGQFTLKCLEVSGGVAYDFSIYNTDTGAFRTLAADQSGSNAVTVKVSKGDYLRFVISTLPNSDNVYPGAVFTFEASFSEGENEEEEKIQPVDYAITVTDENRKPVKGVYLYLNVAGKQEAVATDENGVAHWKLEPGTYQVSLAIPDGYTGRTTQFRLTPERRVMSVKLDTIIIETYTVKAVDETGAPVANVLVTVGSSFGYTDENGIVCFTLEQDAYTAVIGAPEGYTTQQTQLPFPEDLPELTVTLVKSVEEEDPDDGKLTYTVQAVDYNEKPVAELSVQIIKDGAPVAVRVVNEEGEATFRLEPGSYTVVLASAGAAIWYDTETAVLTQEAPELVIRVATAPAGEPEELYVGMAWNVPMGGTYASLKRDVTNYFLFTPEEPGVYRFTTSDKNAVISYWGGSTVSLIVDQTSGTDYDPETNAFTRNIKASNIGMTCVIGITGEGSCVLEITRISDPILDATDIVPDIYEGKTRPSSAYSVGSMDGKKLTYVDLAASSDAVKAVYNEKDGYYHLNSADGPLLYVSLGSNARYVSMYVMLGLTGVGGTSFTQTFYDAEGKAVRREDYTTCMQAYATYADSTYGVYPLTEDLAYMLRQGGDYKGWWKQDSGNYLFTDVENLNTENAWMFAVCWFE